MRALYLLLILFNLSSLALYAQEPGKAGDLLLNEIGTDKLGNIQKNKSSAIPNNPLRLENYRWNYTMGNSEVFIRIPERGRFTIEIADQAITNSNGKFRFFELKQGNVLVSIYQNEFLLYRTRIDVPYKSRLVLDYFSDYGLYLLDVYPINHNSYGINEWDDIWNKPYGGHWNNPNIQYQYGVMNQIEFKNFMSTLKKESFDDGKMSLILSTSRNINFSSQQIREMISLLSFDDNKLTIAKKLYAQCVDKHNYYIVNDAFSFSSNKEKLQDYIRNYK